jgi:hypothetical protein
MTLLYWLSVLHSTLMASRIFFGGGDSGGLGLWAEASSLELRLLRGSPRRYEPDAKSERQFSNFRPPQ